MNRHFACALLEAMGIIRVETASDGTEGLAKVERFAPDLILLDLMMPGMDGKEFLRRLRADPVHAEIPVLVTTAADSQATRNALFEQGASDYVSKPIDRQELVARVRVHLHQYLMLQDLRRYRDRLAQDLATARAMQDSLLPDPALIAEAKARTGIGIAAAFTPSSELGGDLWGVIALDDHRVMVFTVDFSGHGVAAAINTFRLNQMMRGAGLNAGDPAGLLAALNAQLVALLPRGQFATMTVAVIDVAARTLTIANGGGPTPILGCGAHLLGGLDEHFPPLGILPDVAYRNTVVPFPQGSHLALYSDGLSEALDHHGQVLGEAGIHRLLAENIAETPEETLARVMSGFAGLSPVEPRDDITFVWVKT